MRAGLAAALGEATAGGEVLAPVCRASELQGAIEARGLRCFVGDLDVAAVLEHLRQDELPVPAPGNREGYNAGDEPGIGFTGSTVIAR